MKKTHHLSLALTFLGLSLALCAKGQHAETAPPKVLLENDYVRVLETRARPGEKTPVHSHPAHLVYSFSDSKAKATTEAGQTVAMNFKKRTVTWSNPVTHQVENIGSTEAHVLVVELKKEVGRRPPEGNDPVGVDPKGYKVRFENDRVRVLESRLRPRSKVALHVHPASVLYALTSCRIEFTSKEGKTDEIEQKAGEARWVEPVLHSHKQLGSTQAHALLFELKR